MLAIAVGIVFTVLMLRAWPFLIVVPFVAMVGWIVISNPLMGAVMVAGALGVYIFSRLPQETRVKWTRHHSLLKHVRE